MPERLDCCDTCQREDQCVSTYERCIKCHSPPGVCVNCIPCKRHTAKSFRSAAEMMHDSKHQRTKQERIGRPSKGART